ncbi:MAG TPA: hypothetical protein VGM20_13830 [Gemmatimonadales bacterium]
MLTAILILPLLLHAQQPLRAAPHIAVAVRLPMATFHAERDSTGFPLYTAALDRRGNDLLVNGSAGWPGIGLTFPHPWRVTSVRRVAPARISIILDGGGTMRLDLAARDSAWLVHQVFATSADSAQVQAAAEDLAIDRLLGAAAAAGDTLARHELRRVLRRYTPGDTIRVDTLDGVRYLALRTGEPTYACTDALPTRVGTLVREGIAPLLRSIGNTVQHGTPQFGFRIDVTLKSDEMLNGSGSFCARTGERAFTLRVKADDLSGFAANRVSLNELLGRSKGTLGTREVPLTDWVGVAQ